jgi:hypothetical protein
LVAYEALDDTSVIPATAKQHVGTIVLIYPGATSTKNSLGLLKVITKYSPLGTLKYQKGAGRVI